MHLVLRGRGGLGRARATEMTAESNRLTDAATLVPTPALL